MKKEILKHLDRVIQSALQAKCEDLHHNKSQEHYGFNCPVVEETRISCLKLQKYIKND